MSYRHCVAACVAVVVLAFPLSAMGTISVSPTTSYDGSYTVSWNDGGRAYLYQSINGGTWTNIATVTGTYSRAFSGMANGTYSYKLKIYEYDADLRQWVFSYETNVASVLVTALSAPGAPGPISAPPRSSTGAYTLSWGAASGVVSRYDLYENGLLVSTGATALSAGVTGRQNGTYNYKAQACNAAGCGAFTAQYTVVVELAQLSETIADDPVVQPAVPAQQFVGTIPGEAATDGGAANYRIPIEVPPGRAGMQPSVALTYSSRNGNGVAGVGWAVSATSSIYRCPRTLAQDGANATVKLTTADRFCLDGKRLIAKSGSAPYGYLGSEYRTETDDFDRITLKGQDIGGGNSYFDVEHKSGRVTRFRAGLTPTFYPELEYDRQGNCVQYSYALFNSRGSSDFEFVLSAITYTGTMSGLLCVVGSDARRVEFTYSADREDKRTTYIYGFASMSTARLAEITTKVGTQSVRRYELAYKSSAATRRSLLTSVTVCAGGTCGVEKLPPTQFTYQEQPADFVREQRMVGAQYFISVPGDYDGDGTRDTLVSELAPTGWDRTLILSACGSSKPHMDTEGWFPGFDNQGDTVPLRSGGDINNDGRADLLGTQSGSLVLGGSTSACQWRTPDPVLAHDGMTRLPFAAQVNGTSASAIDYDGDGLIDIRYFDTATQGERVFRRLRRDALVFDENSYPIRMPSDVKLKVMMRRDMNGDGLVDTVIDPSQPGTGYSQTGIAFFNGPGTSDSDWAVGGTGGLGGPSGTFQDNPPNTRRWIDVNGDGLPDLWDPSSRTVFINRGGVPRAGMFQPVAVQSDDFSHLTASNRMPVAFVTDVDADGIEELMVPNVRTIEYCGKAPGTIGGEPIAKCGIEFDLQNDIAYDHSVFMWDAYKFQEMGDGQYRAVRVHTNIEAPVNESRDLNDYNGDGLNDVGFHIQSGGSGVFYTGFEDPATQGPYGSRNRASAPDLLMQVQNGLGAIAQWKYKPLSWDHQRTAQQVQDGCNLASEQGGVTGPFYVAHHEEPRSSGYVFFTSSMWVPSRFDVSNGVATGSTMNTTCYRYEDAMLNVEGRGFQGFKKIIAEERLPLAIGEEGAGPLSANNLRTTTEFNQEFPFTNRVKRVSVAVVQPNGGELPVRETRYWWHAELTGPDPLSSPWVVYPNGTKETKFDYRRNQTTAGAPLVTTTSIHEVDLVSGEARKSCVIVDDLATKSTIAGWSSLPASVRPDELQGVTISQETRDLANDTTSWWLGRPNWSEQFRDFTAPYPIPDSHAVATTSTPAIPATPLVCPAVTPSSRAKVVRTNFTWHADSGPTGYKRKLKSEAVVPAVSGTVEEARTTYPEVTGYDAYGNVARKEVTARDVVGTLATTYGYSGDGYFPVTETNTVGHISTTFRDPGTGEVTARQAVQYGPWTRTEYDSLGRVVTVTTDGTQPIYERLAGPTLPNCAAPAIARQTFQAGAPTKTEYLDCLGRVTRTESQGFGATAVNFVHEVAFNERGLKVTEYAPRDSTSTSTFPTRYSRIDALGRVGRKEVIRDATLFSTSKGEPTLTTDYDYQGLKTNIHVYKPAAQGGTLEMSRTYDARGKLIETRQTVSTPTTHEILIRYVYEPAGTLTHIVDGGPAPGATGNDLGATYDDLGRKRTVQDPDRGNWSYTWDGLGRLRYQTDARGAVITQEYDGIGRPMLRITTAPNGTSTTDAAWYYDQNGRFGVLDAVERTTEFYRRDYRYDDLLRPFKVTTQMRADDVAVPAGTNRSFTVEYGYDHGHGRLKAMRYPSVTGGQSGETVAFDYDDRGHLLGETQLVNGTRAKQYRRVRAMSPREQVTDEVLGNCVSELTQFDGSAGLATFMTAVRPIGLTSLPASLSSCPAGTSLIRQVDYAHDHFLNLQRQVKNIAGVQRTEAYAYDELQRITSASPSWPLTPPVDYYGYDDLGNITSKNDYGLVYTYGNSARITRLAGPHAVSSVAKIDGTTATFTYDKNGNLIDGDGRTIDFDLLDRPIHVAQSGAMTDFAYAPDGSRYKERISGAVGCEFGPKTIYSIDKDYEVWVWSPCGARSSTVVEERTFIGGSVVVYRRDSNPPEVRYKHVDRLGSLDAVTKDDPASPELYVDTHGYDPFGKPRARDWTPSGERLHPSGDLGATTDRGFTGHEHLDVHYLIHMNGRVYDYRLGRFLSVDPIVSNPANSQSINPYSYIGNNPLSGTDPTGYDVCPQGKADMCEGARPEQSKEQSKQPNSMLEAHKQGSIAGRAGDNTTINGVDQNIVARKADAEKPKTNGASGQGKNSGCSNAADCGSPQETAWKTKGGEETSTGWLGGGSGWIGGDALDRDIKDLTEGRISEAEYWARIKARGVGAAVGAAIDAVVIGGVLVVGSAAEGTGVIGLSQQVAARAATTGAGPAAGAAAAAGGAAEAVKVGEYTLTSTVAGKLAERPYLNSPLTLREIMAAGKPIPDPGGVTGALRWDVPGAFRGSAGTWELVVNPQSRTVLHWVFKSAPKAAP